MRWKQVICSLVSKYFDIPQLAIQLYKTLDYWSQNMLKFNFSEKGLGLISPSHFFQEKYFSCSILLTDQIHCLIAFTSRDIGLYVFYNCFLTRLWRHKSWNKHYLFNQAVLIQDQKVKPKTSISWERKELLKWNKNHFSSLLKGFQLPKIVSDLRVRL